MNKRILTIDKDEKILRQVSNPVDFKDLSYKEDLEILRKYCNETNVFAVAAIQLGIPKKIIYVKNTDQTNMFDENHNEGKVIINPMIIDSKGITTYWESCISCLDSMSLVERPYEITLRYFDENKVLKVEIFSGFAATVISHEYDHLNGILHIDKAIAIKNMPKKERIEFRKLNPYTIISKENIVKEKTLTMKIEV